MELGLNTSTDKEPNHTDTKMSSSSSRHIYATPATTRLRSDYDINVIRLIGHHLNSLGLNQTVELLLRETGVPSLDHPIADRIQRHIMAGEFDAASLVVEELADLVVEPYAQTAQQQESSKSYRLQKLKTAGLDHALRSAENSSSNKRKCAPSSRPLDKKQIINAMRIAIAEQKYLELLEDKQRMDALKCLQTEITPFVTAVDRDSLPRLATLILCRSPEDLKQRANWPGKGHHSRQLVIEKLRNHVPPFIILPAGRLSTLLNQASQLQRERCVFHIEHKLFRGTVFNPNDSIDSNEPKSHENYSLMSLSDNNGQLSDTYLNKETNGHCATAIKVEPSSIAPSSSSSSMSLDTASFLNTNHLDLVYDHSCPSDKFPLQILHDYDHHMAEVWNCSFSNDGLKLATGGFGGKIKLWQMNPVKQELVFDYSLDCTTTSISCLSWSPDDVHLLACGSEERSNLWLINVKKGELRNTINYSTEQDNSCSYTTCSWHLSGTQFAAASLQGNLQLFDLDCNQIGKRDELRVRCLSFLHKDPKYILAADIHDRIRAYSIEEMCNPVRNPAHPIGVEDKHLIQEQFHITSFVISPDDKYIAVNLQTQGIHLWDYQNITLLRVFNGLFQQNTAIFSSFSRLPSSVFLASGSEDGDVYIYTINRPDRPLVVLKGHRRCVNCVTWNPKYPEFLVSVSDDRRIRLWGPLSTQDGE